MHSRQLYIWPGNFFPQNKNYYPKSYKWLKQPFVYSCKSHCLSVLKNLGDSLLHPATIINIIMNVQVSKHLEVDQEDSYQATPLCYTALDAAGMTARDVKEFCDLWTLQFPIAEGGRGGKIGKYIPRQLGHCLHHGLAVSVNANSQQRFFLLDSTL